MKVIKRSVLVSFTMAIIAVVVRTIMNVETAPSDFVSLLLLLLLTVLVAEDVRATR